MQISTVEGLISIEVSNLYSVVCIILNSAGPLRSWVKKHGNLELGIPDKVSLKDSISNSDYRH